MGLFFMDGFDHEQNFTDLATKWTTAVQNGFGAQLTSATVPYAYGQSLALQCWSLALAYVYKTFPGNLARVIAGFAINPPGGGGNHVINFMDGATVQCFAQYNSANGAYDFYQAGNLLGSTPNASFPSGIFNYMEIDVTINAAGAVTIYKNGIAILTLAAVNTQTSANTWTNQIQFTANSSNNNYYIDDLYLLDPSSGPYAAALGPSRITVSKPTANDAVQFNPVGLATNFDNVDAVPYVAANAAADYNISPGVGNQDTFPISAIPFAPSTIFGVAVNSMNEQDAAGTVEMANVIKSGATTTLGANVSVANGTYKYQQDIFVADPSTAAPWTIAGVNAAKIGYNQTA